MIITKKINGTHDEFLSLLASTHLKMLDKNKTQPDFFYNRDPKKFEQDLFQAINLSAKSTVFDQKIELISGHKFPDIVIADFYGIEVKTSKKDWKSLGNSVLETTRIETVKDIYLYFGKLSYPIEFRYRPYHECLYEVAVTHSPRYLIDMNLPKGETIFDRINISYNELRLLENPIKPFVDYYKRKSKHGEETWWMGSGGNEEIVTSPIVRFLNELSNEEKISVLAETWVLFPELLSGEFKRVSSYLVIKHGLISWNLRDSYTSGGQQVVSFNKKTFQNMPAIYLRLFNISSYINDAFLRINTDELAYHWSCKKSQIIDAKRFWLLSLLRERNDNKHKDFIMTMADELYGMSLN